MEQAREVIVMADGSKAGKVSFACAGRWDHVHILITDRPFDFSKKLASKGIKIVRA
jgi:DeoR/GlpR family transcriptional regulator of sugar metabolism